MIIALDPSSTCIGYAHFTRAGQMFEAGCVTAKQRDGPYVRMVKLAEEIIEMVQGSTPESRIIWVVEVPSGHVNHRRHKGNGAGLSVYGVAVGYLLGRLANLEGCDVRIIMENDWTRGIPKGKRQAWVAATHPSYRAATDPGGDIADAIGLGEWWITEQKLNGKTALARVGGR